MKSRSLSSRATGVRAWFGALLAVLALFALPAVAVAAPGWTANVDVIDSEDALAPDVAVDREGAAVAVWNRANGIAAATRTQAGIWSTPVELEATGLYPRVALGPDGTATAVWVRWNTDYEVWTSTRDAAGAWSEPELLSSADASAQNPRPQVVIDRAGNATAVWAQNCSVYSARRPANGEWSSPAAIWTDPTPAELEEPCDLYRLEGGSGQTLRLPVFDADLDAAGNVTVVWRAGRRIISTSEKRFLYSVRPAGGSSSWTPAETLLPPTLKPRSPQLEVWDDGRAIVTWGLNNLGVRAVARPAGASAAWGSPVELSSAGVADLSAAYDAHGNATVAWVQPATEADPATMRVATLDAAGTWGAGSTAATMDAGMAATNPVLTVSRDGDAIVAWTLDGPTEEDRVVQSVRRPAGGSWEETITHGREVSSNTDSPAVLAGDALGNAALVWVGDGTHPLGGETQLIRTADYAVTPALRADWTANGLVGAGNLRSWIDYVYNGSGTVEPSGGATRPDPGDRYSHRLATSDAWIEQSTGETVVQLQGAIRFQYSGHHIDIRIVDPQIRVAADGKTARLVADGQGSGDMAEAIKGSPKVEPFDDLHLLNLSLPSRLQSRDGEVQSWISAAAKIAPGDGARILSYSAGSPYGFFTFSAPAELPTRDTRPIGPGPGPGENPPPPSSGTTPPSAAPPVGVKPKPKAKKCGKGKKRVKVKGKSKCVKAKKGKAEKGKKAR